MGTKAARSSRRRGSSKQQVLVRVQQHIPGRHLDGPQFRPPLAVDEILDKRCIPVKDIHGNPFLYGELRKFRSGFLPFHGVLGILEAVGLEQGFHLQFRMLVQDVQHLDEVPDHFPGSDVGIRPDPLEFDPDEATRSSWVTFGA